MIRTLPFLKDNRRRSYETAVFTSDLFHLLPRQFQSDFTFLDRLKLLLRVWRGYRLYMVIDGEKLCAYTFLKRNYLHKYAFMQRGDFLINPYYVHPDYRGFGLAQAMIAHMVGDLKDSPGRIWAVVKEDNIPSLTVLKKCAFEHIGFSEKHAWSHCLTNDKTHLYLFCHKKLK